MGRSGINAAGWWVLAVCALGCTEGDNTFPAASTSVPTATTSEPGTNPGTTSEPSTIVLPDEAPSLDWHRGHGTNGEEHVHEGVQTADGGFVAVGHTQDVGGGWTTDMLVVKTDAQGDLEWFTRLGTDGRSDVGIAVAEVSDGYVVAGGLWDGNTQQSALVKLDASGQEVWRGLYDDDGYSALRGLEVLADGRIVATGYTGGFEPGFVFISEESTGVLRVVDGSGQTEWSVELPVPQGTKVRQTADGGFAVLTTVWTFAGGTDVQNAGVVKTTANGSVEWGKTFGGTEFNQAFDFDLTADGGFVLAGHTLGHGAVNWDCLMTRVDASGNELWASRFGQPRGYDAAIIHDECYGIRVDADGRYVMAGGTGDEYPASDSGHPSGPSDEWKGLLLKADEAGQLVWMEVYGDGAGAGHNATEFLSLTDDGGYLLFNDTDSAGSAQPNNFGFMKLSYPEP